MITENSFSKFLPTGVVVPFKRSTDVLAAGDAIEATTRSARGGPEIAASILRRQGVGTDDRVGTEHTPANRPSAGRHDDNAAQTVVSASPR